MLLVREEANRERNHYLWVGFGNCFSRWASGMYIVITSATQWNHELSSLWGFSLESPVIQQLCIIGLKGVYDFVVVNIMLIWNYCNYSDLGLHEVEIQKCTIIAFCECMKWLELLMVALEWYWSYWSYWRWHWSCWWLPWYTHLQTNSNTV
jgi:hypothetical protein